MRESDNFLIYERSEWQALNDRVDLELTDEKLESIRSLNDKISIDDVRDIYVPIVQLLDIVLANYKQLKQTRADYLTYGERSEPYIIGIAGSVAVGKSTVARLLQTLLAQFHPQQQVDLITTDGFLYPNQVLAERHMMDKKGFPESYDMERLIRFLADVKNGKPTIQVPKYSHEIYDIVPDEFITVDKPDILIVEGINVLQLPSNEKIFVSDFFDFSFYVDAKPELIEKWYLGRIGILLDTAFQKESNYYNKLANMPRKEAFDYARNVWKTVNLVNLQEYILPTRFRADLILHKTHDHYIDQVLVKK